MIIDFPTNKPIPLPQNGSWPKSMHRFDDRSALALNAALAAQRPLLVRGNPGIGKSQLARAAAQHLGRCFVAEVVHAGTESRDLQCRFDAVGRLGEAQALAAACRFGENKAVDRLDHRLYVSPGPLWWTFDWKSAMKQAKFALRSDQVPEAPDGWTPERGCVLLVDEIDKANADLPNGLLETLGNGGFVVPHVNEPVCIRSGQVPPLVVVTTNEERELPDAFVRRCLVLHLFLPDDDPRHLHDEDESRKNSLVSHLSKLGRDHFLNLEESVLREAASQLWQDREAARNRGLAPPGLAEYLDLLRAVEQLGSTESGRLKLLREIREFVFKKHEELL